MNQFDLVLLLLLAGAFVLGFFQGFIRQLLGVGAWLVAFVLAAHLREPLGRWLDGQWTDFVPAYNQMLAFGILFVVIFGTLIAAVQLVYRESRYAVRYFLVDELVGGLLAAGLALLVMAALIVILDSFYGRVTSPQAIGLAWLTDLHRALDSSTLANGLRDSLIVGLGAVLDPLLPQTVRDVMR